MTDPRERVTTGAVWESQVGYCRAVRSGDYICVSGTAPVASGGGVHAPGDGTAQSRRCIEIIAGVEHVVRTRMYVTDISRWEEFGLPTPRPSAPTLRRRRWCRLLHSSIQRC